MAFSLDGQRIVTGSDDQTAKVWDAASGKELIALSGHSNLITAATFSPDGRRIVTGSHDRTARVWEAASGRELLTLKRHTGWIESVAFSPDGLRIVTGSDDQTAEVWDAASGKELLTLVGHDGGANVVAFSPDGQRIVTGDDSGVARVWEAATGRELLTFNGHGGPVISVAFSPDGRRIVTGSYDRKAKVWDAASGRELLTLKGHTGHVVAVTFSTDGQRILTGSRDQTVRVWEAARPEQVVAWRQEDELGKIYGLLRRGAELTDQGRLAEAGQLLTRLLTNANVSAAQTAQILASRANVRARSGRWEEAAGDLARAIEQDPADHLLWHSLAPILVKTGQLEAYREHCRKSLERFGKTTDPYTADRIAKDCLILPGSGANLDTVATMADTAVSEGQHNPIALTYHQFGKGLAEYRQGRFGSAADWMGAVLTNRWYHLDVHAEAYMVLAMSQHQLQQIEPARATFAKGAEVEQKLPKLDGGDPGDAWIDNIIAHVLMSEAKAMIGTQPAKAEPNSPAPPQRRGGASKPNFPQTKPNRVRMWREGQAPSGAACRGSTVPTADMPLLTELERGPTGTRCYKYGAPNGAVTPASGCEISALNVAAAPSCLLQPPGLQK